MKERREKAGLKTSQGKHAAKEKPEKHDGKLTVASILGKETIKLFKKPASRSDEPVPAKRLADQPYGSFDLGNDTRCYLYVTTNAAGELVIKRDIRRIEA